MTPYHILLVDDDVLASEALKEHLEGKGYSVTLAEGCQQAREILRGSTKVDLMVLDYMMPDGLGTDLLQSMAGEQSLQRPQVIMSSSWIDSNNPAWDALRKRLPAVSQSLIQAYMSKPFTFENMDTVVGLIVDASANPPHSNVVSSGDFPPPRRIALRKSNSGKPTETTAK
jgi:DNA-binding response OmpR family regulator